MAGTRWSQAAILGDRPKNLTEASINGASNGNNILIAGISGKIIKVWKLFVVFNAAVNIKWIDGTTDLTGVKNMLANGSITLDLDGDPWFTCSSGNDFILNLSGAVQSSGRIYYTQDTT